jgi:SAM-dependent methyltransferase
MNLPMLVMVVTDTPGSRARRDSVGKAHSTEGACGLAADNNIQRTSGTGVREVDWTAYSQSYDAIVGANPAYRMLVDRVGAELDAIGLCEDAVVADLGCGTGTFTRLLLDRVPGGQVHALDKSRAFLDHLESKLGGHVALRAAVFDMDAVALPPATFDAILAIHVLCHSSAPERVLTGIFSALKPGGAFVVADIGRRLDLVDWSKYVVSSLSADYGRRGWGGLGVLPAAAFVLRHRKAVRENRNFAARQRAGLVWKHTLGEFTAVLQAAGFEVRVADDREYRGIDSFAVAIKPLGAA